MSARDKRIADAAERAGFAFWEEVARCFPEADAGDFPPDATFEIDEAMKTAVQRWTDYNAPERSRADIIRERLKFLHVMGDAACGCECWRDTDERLEAEYSWIMADELDERVEWPIGCRK